MSLYKIMIYGGAATLGSYFLMKVVERDPETLRKQLPERYELNYETESRKRTEAFMQVLKRSAAGEEPEAAVKKLKDQMEKTVKTQPTQTS